jgi:hypothetical protein
MRIAKNFFERAAALTKINGRWIVASLETEIFWPLKAQTASYNGREFLLLPNVPAEGATADNPLAVDKLPAIALCVSKYSLTEMQGRAEIMRFASALAWQEGAKIEIAMWSGGNLPRQTGRARNRTVRDYLEVDWLQSPDSDGARTALAFYREGISLDNPFYAFLSLYKAFSVAVPSGERANWMARKHNLGNEQARKRLEELERVGHNIGDYLYTQGRHAIAHADREPFVDPDRTDDHFRLQHDLPLMRNFAEIAIEETYSVYKPQTIYQQHLYELEGFRMLVSTPLVAALKRGAGVPIRTHVQWPGQWLILAARGHEQHPLSGMEPVFAAWDQTGITLRFRSRGGIVELSVRLDFRNERIIFDPIGQFSIFAKRGSRQQIEEELGAARFLLALLSNGHIELWDAVSEQRLGRSQGYIPINMMVNVDWFNAQITELEGLLAERG